MEKTTEQNESIIKLEEWTTLVNKGCRSPNLSTRYKYLEYVGEICGYRGMVTELKSNEFEESISEMSEEEYLKKVVTTIEAETTNNSAS